MTIRLYNTLKLFFWVIIFCTNTKIGVYCNWSLPKFLKNSLIECRCFSSQEWYCQSSFYRYIDYGFSISYDDPDTRTNVSKNVCFAGIPLVVSSCICYFNSNGVSCHSKFNYEDNYSGGSRMDIYSGNDNGMIDNFLYGDDFEKLHWKTLSNHSNPHHQVVTNDLIFENEFVIVSTGRKFADVKLETTYHANTDKIYRFSLYPHHANVKSRIELSTCFVHQDRFNTSSGLIPPYQILGTSLITYCKVANIPIESLSTFSYELFLPSSIFTKDSKYIITQWHGSPNPNILLDQKGCTASLRDVDRYILCNLGYCNKGLIYDDHGDLMDVKYHCCGYPPLSLHVRDGKFVVVARSDERFFIPRGGCLFNNTLCPLHPRQQIHILLELPFEKFKFDSWVNFEWKIKWSEYSNLPEVESQFSEPGRILSNAWIQLRIDGKLLVDWVGPCGRNEEGRVPFFKIGVYSPNGNLQPIMYYMKRYQHSYKMPNEINDETERNKLNNLNTETESPLNNITNINHYDVIDGFKRISGNCTLQTRMRPLVEFERIFNDNRTSRKNYDGQLIVKLIDIIKIQNSKILDLEEKLLKYGETSSLDPNEVIN